MSRPDQLTDALAVLTAGWDDADRVTQRIVDVYTATPPTITTHTPPGTPFADQRHDCGSTKYPRFRGFPHGDAV